MAQGTHEIKDQIAIEQPYVNKHILRGFDSNNEGNQGWFLRGIQLPKIDTRKFVGKDVLTWICQMEHFFDLHQVSTLQR